MADTIGVLVVDDSPFFAEAITTVLEEDPAIRVVGVAADGKQAIDLAVRRRPDLITMDIQMPVLGGLQAIEAIMARAPTPILVLTDDPGAYSGELSFDALRRGALDLMPKPMGWDASAPHLEAVRERVKALAGIAVVRHLDRSRTPSKIERPPKIPSLSKSIDLVAIVASTGGPSALATILTELPNAFPPIVVVQHLAAGFSVSLARWLDRTTQLGVRVARDGERLRLGEVHIAPDGQQIEVDDSHHIRLRPGPTTGHCPSGTVFLESVAGVYGRRALGLVLSGMGEDGAQGMLAMRRRGALTIAQDEKSSVVYGMPRVARELGAVKLVLGVQEIARTLRALHHAAQRRGRP